MFKALINTLVIINFLCFAGLIGGGFYAYNTVIKSSQYKEMMKYVQQMKDMKATIDANLAKVQQVEKLLNEKTDKVMKQLDKVDSKAVDQLQGKATTLLGK